eukprot:3472374-Prymnesium_polylepis.1
MRVDCWRREDGESGEPLSTGALTKGLSEPWREALARVGEDIFCPERVATPVGRRGFSNPLGGFTLVAPHARAWALCGVYQPTQLTHFPPTRACL